MLFYEEALNISDRNKDLIKLKIISLISDMEECEFQNQLTKDKINTLNNCINFIDKNEFDNFISEIYYYQKFYGGISKISLYADEPENEIVYKESEISDIKFHLRYITSLLNNKYNSYIEDKNLLKEISNELKILDSLINKME